MSETKEKIEISGIQMAEPDIFIEVDGVDLTLEELIKNAESKKEEEKKQ